MFVRAMSSLLVLVLVMLALVAGGIWLGANPRWLPEPVRSTVAGQSGAEGRFNEALATIQRTYYRKLTKDQLVDRAISGMVGSLKDPYSQYFTAEQYRSFLSRQAQSFSGIGVAVQPDKKGLRIMQVYAGSPAREAGLKPGDVIVSAGGRALGGLPESEAVALVKGKEGTKVVLGIARTGRPRRLVTVARRQVVVPSVDSRVRTFEGKRYLQLAIGSFTQNNVAAQVRRQLDKGRKAGIKGIVLDLRHNPGGLVDQAGDVASLFLPGGKVVVSTRGRAVAPSTLKTTGNPADLTTPMVVLVDRGTASAAEIVAGALQDHGRAKLVGTNTYGKGVFQQVLPQPDGGALDLTAGEYFTPKGRNLGAGGVREGKGLTPDVRISKRDMLRPGVALDTALRTVAAEVR